MGNNRPGPRPLSGALNEARGPAAGLYDRARQLREWEQGILRALPAQAEQHVRLARVDRDELVLVTDGPEWRHQLRYLAPRLQEQAFQQTGIRPQRVTVKVGDLPRRTDRGTPRTLSSAAGRTLASAADHADNPKLAEALARLASRSERTGS